MTYFTPRHIEAKFQDSIRVSTNLDSQEVHMDVEEDNGAEILLWLSIEQTVELRYALGQALKHLGVETE